ncbi:MAG: hypothetical protein P8N31_11495 [Planctomycetota bacterium]|nr:hypothetical protein [Planctomycetota bacterium]
MLFKISALCALAAAAPLLATQDPATELPGVQPSAEVSSEAEADELPSGAQKIIDLVNPVQDKAEDGVPNESATEDAPLPNNLDQQEKEYFTTCDYDANGWISYREAEASLHLNRDGFAQYDANDDGQVTREEFHDRYTQLIQRVGIFRIPTPIGQTEPAPAVPVEPGAAPAFPATSQAFVNTYDANVDGRLDVSEVGPAATSLGFPNVDPVAVLKLLDKDGSSFVEPAEIAAIIQGLNASGATITAPKAASIDELFGKSLERPYFVGATPRPPLIQGPVIPFRRLDVNNNGFIEVADLEKLSVSAHTVIRPSAVLAGLDRDGDGKLSPEELKAAFDG